MSVPEKQSNRKLKVAILMGGSSSEREVSLASGQMISRALDRTVYDVVAIDTRDLLHLAASETSSAAPHSDARSIRSAGPVPARSGPSAEPGALSPARWGTSSDSGAANAPAPSGRPDVVFIALHGKGGEDGTVQGLLEVLGVPYTGSGVLASALAMDKVMSKRLFESAGIPVIDGIFVTRAGLSGGTEADFRRVSANEVETRLGFPVFVKPNAGGSTCGCSLVTAADQLFKAVREALEFDETVLIEKYIRGTEITVGVLDFQPEPMLALPVIEIVPKSEYYDYESKYVVGGSEHIIPARLPEAMLLRAQEIARECHRLLGCRTLSRTDLIAADGRLYVLEVNTIPGMTPTSLLPQAAEHAGIPFSELLDRIVRSAMPAV